MFYYEAFFADKKRSLAINFVTMNEKSYQMKGYFKYVFIPLYNFAAEIKTITLTIKTLRL